jgi:UDP-N-acetylmuramoyl-L-alanyl-D-glutamate--2,6-diaminopimelate ligase
MTPAWLAERLARMEAAGCTHAFVEISSQTLCQKKLGGVELDTVCVTMVDSQRLDLHHTTQNYRDAEHSVLDYLAAAGVAIINADDPVSCRWLSDVDGPAIAYGVGEQAQISADVIERNACETTFILAAGADSAAVRTTMVGDEHVSNCLAAAATALAHGIDLPAIARGIEAVKSLPARMERINCGQDFAVFVDAAHTACGLRASLRTARRLSRGRVICVLGDSSPATRGERAAIRGVVEKMADVTIVTDALAALDAAWLHEDESLLRQVAADRDEAIALAVAEAEPGDVVVIAGSRGPTGFNFGAARTADAETLKKLLYGLAPQTLRLVG